MARSQAAKAAPTKAGLPVVRQGEDPFAMLYLEVMADPRLDHNGVSAYVCLVTCVEYYKRTLEDLTRAEIAAVMRMSVDSLDRGFRQLKDCGYLEIIKRYLPGTNSRAASGYRLFDTKLSRLQREMNASSTESNSVDNAPQLERAESPQDDKTAGQGGRTQRQPKSGQDEPLIAHSDDPHRSQRQGSSLTAAAIPLKEVKKKQEKTPPAPPVESVPVDNGPGSGGEGDFLIDLVRELRDIRPDWTTGTLMRVLTDPEVAERPRALVRRAALIVARDPVTQRPGRLLVDGPWWYGVPLGETPPPPLAHCGRCTPWRRLEDPETGGDAGPCPTCHPSMRRAAGHAP